VTSQKRNDVHPTMKPIKLLEPLIKNSSKEKEIIADGFLGSGSTMVAAHQLNRVCYGLELDPRYCQVIIDRMQKLDPTLSVKINGKNYDRILQNFDKSN
jgi:DNA modification methylase